MTICPSRPRSCGSWVILLIGLQPEKALWLIPTHDSSGLDGWESGPALRWSRAMARSLRIVPTAFPTGLIGSRGFKTVEERVSEGSRTAGRSSCNRPGHG